MISSKITKKLQVICKITLFIQTITNYKITKNYFNPKITKYVSTLKLNIILCLPFQISKYWLIKIVFVIKKNRGKKVQSLFPKPKMVFLWLSQKKIKKIKK